MKTATLAAACLLLSGLTLFQFCVKPPYYPDEPAIVFKSISKTLMRQSVPSFPADSVLVTFTYTDGDGDLGSEDGSDKSAVFYIDQRDSFPRTPYTLPYIEPQGTGNGISGEISVNLPSVNCIYTDASGNTTVGENVPVDLDTLVYIIYIRDRAGHESNRIVTPPITLICKQ